MRIAFVAWRDLDHPQAGGSELLVHRLLEGLADRGHRPTLLCGGPVGERAYPVVRSGGDYSQYVLAPLAYARALRGWDLLVDVENGIPFFSPLWRRGPVICMVHHLHGDQWSQRFPPPVARLGSFLEAWAMPRIYRHDLFVDCSASTASALTRIGVDLGRIRDLPVGVDRPPPNTGHSKSPTPMFLALGRLVPHKRIDLLIRMWTQVQAAVGGTLLIAGDGPESDALRRVGGPGIRFLGAVSENEKWRLLRESWALVHPAMHEGWGIVVMEAAVCGTPAVGFDVSGVRDSIVDDETGVLARSEADFVRKWALLASDEGLRTRLGRAAAIRAEQATWDRTIDTFLDVAHEAVDRHQRRFQRHPRARPK